MSSLAGRDWFEKPALKRIFALLNADGGEVRIVGGAVRNALMDLPVVDVDLATTLTPMWWWRGRRLRASRRFQPASSTAR